MKALIRKSNETIIESDGIAGIDWNTGTPLTNPSWAGGPYRLVHDFVEPVEQDSEPVDGEVVDGTEYDSTRVVLPETVSYGGKEYTLEELKKLIG